MEDEKRSGDEGMRYMIRLELAVSNGCRACIRMGVAEVPVAVRTAAGSGRPGILNYRDMIRLVYLVPARTHLTTVADSLPGVAWDWLYPRNIYVQFPYKTP